MTSGERYFDMLRQESIIVRATVMLKLPSCVLPTVFQTVTHFLKALFVVKYASYQCLNSRTDIVSFSFKSDIYIFFVVIDVTEAKMRNTFVYLLPFISKS